MAARARLAAARSSNSVEPCCFATSTAVRSEWIVSFLLTPSRNRHRPCKRPDGSACQARIGIATGVELRHETLEAHNDAGAGILVAPEQCACILGIERVRELGRTDQIAEENRDLPAFGFGGLRGRCGNARRLLRRCLSAALRIECTQKLAPVTKRQTELLEVIFRQLAQDIEVDVVLDKDLGVLCEPLCLKPLLDVGHAIRPPSLAVGVYARASSLQRESP